MTTAMYLGAPLVPVPVNDIIDAHHHLWDLEAVRYPWLLERGVKRFFGDPTPIQRNYLPADFERDIGSLPVSRSVHIQVGAAPGQSLAETEWLQSVSESGKHKPQAIVAFADLSADDIEETLDRQLAYPSLRGIRQIVGRSVEEDAKTGTATLLGNPDWVEGLASLIPRGLSFDLQLIPAQIPDALAVLRQLPDLPVAVCHCASPWDQSRQGLKTWRAHVRALAELPRVFCKLSGFGMFDHNWTVESIRPIILEAVDAFGVSRCMFGSNFPVDKLHRDYAALYDAYFNVVHHFSPDEKQALFCDTAASFYRI